MNDNPNFIAPGDKFAMLAAEVAATGMPSVPTKVGRLWVPGQPIVNLEGHWLEWLGSLRSEDLQDATLFVVDKVSSKTPSILDGESDQLMNRTSRFYTALMLTGRFAVPRDPMLITGGNDKGEIDIRQVTSLDPQPYVPGLDLHDVTIGNVTRAALLAESFETMAGLSGFARLSRILGTYVEGRCRNEPLDQLHQFCRCIEGLIIPGPGESRARFQSRTQLFIGPKHQQLMVTLYENRSAVEHLNDHLLVLEAGRDARIEILRQSIIAENIARQCLARIYETPAVWPHFQTDDALKAFWKLSETERQNIWGAPFDPLAVLADFDPNSIRNHELGLK